MNPVHIDDFYYTTAEILCGLYAAFSVRRFLLVEDISGPISWDMTGLPDRRSRATFETIVWLAEHQLLAFRSVEPRDVGVEGAVLTQTAFVLLTGRVQWQDGTALSRIDALQQSRSNRAYSDLGTLIQDLLRANCQWSAPTVPAPLEKAGSLSILDEGE